MTTVSTHKRLYLLVLAALAALAVAFVGVDAPSATAVPSYQLSCSPSGSGTVARGSTFVASCRHGKPGAAGSVTETQRFTSRKVVGHRTVVTGHKTVTKTTCKRVHGKRACKTTRTRVPTTSRVPVYKTMTTTITASGGSFVLDSKGNANVSTTVSRELVNGHPATFTYSAGGSSARFDRQIK